MARNLDSLADIQQRDPMVRFRFDDQLGVVQHLRGTLATVESMKPADVQAAGLAFLAAHPDLFAHIRLDHTTVLQVAPDPQGGVSVTLQQYHGSYRVYNGSIRFHVNQDQVLDTVSNHLFPDLDKVPLEPRTGVDKAVQVAQKETRCDAQPEHAPELVVYRHEGNPYLAWEIHLNDTKPNPNRLTWQARHRGAKANAGEPPAEWIVYVDATSGRVLTFYDNVQTAGPTTGLGQGIYSGPGTVHSWSTGSTYQLRNTTSVNGPEIITNDEDGASPSEDPDNNWDDLTTTPRDQCQGAEVDAHRFLETIVDYFRLHHGRNSYDGNGGGVTADAHAYENWTNARWTGSMILLGDGDGITSDYWTADDVVAHEFTHAVTEYTCDLQYLNEPGALNEAFSDVFAAFATGDWLFNQDGWLGNTAPALRNMMDPTNGGKWDPANPIGSTLAGHQPSHYSARYTGSWDSGGVHVNSGIVNNLFYLLTVGGTHTISGGTVTGIGQSAAEQLIYRCMTVNLVGNQQATFLDFREAMLDACLDLFPTDLSKLMQVKNAFNAVGIGPDIYVRDSLADTGQEPYPGPVLCWSPDIINRTVQSQSPATEFANLSTDVFSQNVEYGQDNYVYVRLQNRGSHSGDATINVYFAPLATSVLPANWQHIGTLIQIGIAPGKLCVAGPLVFPKAAIPAPEHYCMIAMVSDALDPAPDTSLITSVSEYLTYVRDENNVAYRNMDVVDQLPNSGTGSFAFTVYTMGGRERFDLRFELAHFVPGGMIRIHGSTNVLDAAIARGLKLVQRERDENVYEVLGGRELVKHQAFVGGGEDALNFPIGFDNLLVEHDIRLKVDYRVPPEYVRMLNQGLERKPYPLVIRQLWHGETVGTCGVRLGAVKPRRQPRKVRKPDAAMQPASTR